MIDEEYERPSIDWDIHHEGREWTADEFELRSMRIMNLHFEVSDGKLFGSEKTRRMVLGMLLENVGIDEAVRLGDPAVWKEAIDELLAEQTKP